MSNKIKFQFDDKLQYQLDAVSSVVRLFDGLPQNVGGLYANATTRIKRLIEGDPVRNVEITTGTRLLDNLRNVQRGNNLYTYNELFCNNFTIEMLCDHFKAIYNVDLSEHSFVYDSGNPHNVSTNFVEVNDLAICVINIQAFNTCMPKSRFSHNHKGVEFVSIHSKSGAMPVYTICREGLCSMLIIE